MALTEARLDELRSKHGKIGVVDFNGHVLVFRRPSRENIRDYRRKQDSASEKMDALDQLAQITILAFDDTDDPNGARRLFTDVFLEEFPGATSHKRFVLCLSALGGMVEDEDAADLGKGVSVRDSRPARTPTASPIG